MEREIWEIVKALDEKKLTAIEAHKKLCGLYIVSDSAFNVGDKVWYKNKLRRIIDIKGEDIELWDFGNRIKLKRKALIYDLKHCW